LPPVSRSCYPTRGRPVIDHLAAIEDLARRFGASISASTLHGQLTGMVCGGAGSNADERLRVYAAWLGAEPDRDAIAVIDSLYRVTCDALWQHSDLDLRLLIPADSTPIGHRAAAIAAWCDGFLTGFGAAASPSRALSPDVGELLQDFSRIAAIDEAMPEDDDNEHDLMQIVEYVRVGVALVFAECGANADRPGAPS